MVVKFKFNSNWVEKMGNLKPKMVWFIKKKQKTHTDDSQSDCKDHQWFQIDVINLVINFASKA